jgi:hypothetical protein
MSEVIDTMAKVDDFLKIEGLFSLDKEKDDITKKDIELENYKVKMEIYFQNMWQKTEEKDIDFEKLIV